jgi:hypothetical protein
LIPRKETGLSLHVAVASIDSKTDQPKEKKSTEERVEKQQTHAHTHTHTHSHSAVMDTNMEDVGMAPADVSPVQTEPASIGTLDGWIENLMNCKQLAENDVQRLCDKVGHSP